MKDGDLRKEELIQQPREKKKCLTLEK